jgi:hypothetical protein
MHWQNFRFNGVRFTTIATLAVALVACGPNAQQLKDQAKKQTDQQQKEAQKNRVLGPLDEMNRKITAQPDSLDKGACDIANADIRKDLIKAIEERYGKESTAKTESEKPIAETAKKSKVNPPLKVDFAGSYLVKIEKGEPDAEGQWQILTSSWKKEKAFFEKYGAVNTAAFWNRLYADVRTLLETDLARVRQGTSGVASKNLGISKDTAKKIAGLQEHMKPCAAQKDCFSVTWSAEELEVIKQVPLYSHFLEKMGTASTNDGKRSVIETWYGFLRDDAFEHSFKKNATVKYSVEDKKDIFTLPLDAHQLSDAERAFLKESIESIWKSDAAEVRIEWKTVSDKTDPIFQVVFHKETGIRANTSTFEGNKVNLYTGTDNRAIAHEIGHVLGFPEHYYPFWNSETCAYETQYSIDDLMSNQKLGDVSGDDWSELKAEYSAAQNQTIVD